MCCLDRKKESKAEKKEKQDRKKKKKKMEDEEKAEMKGKGKGKATSVDEETDEDEESASGNPPNGDDSVDTDLTAHGAATGESVIGPRYAKLIGVNLNNDDASAPSNSKAKETGKQTSKRERSMVHLPVLVSDLGTPRQSQMPEYEREDPGDEERDERGFRRGASWWHPEL